MRAEGREVRCVGAIKLLTAKQVQVQLALRHFLDKLSVRRSGKDGELRPLLEAAVAAEVAARAAVGGGVEPTVEVEISRLKALGFGKKARDGGGQRQPRAPRQPRTARQPRARPTASDADEGSDESGSDESSSDADGSGSDGSSDEDEDEIDIDELLQKDEDVYEVEKLLEWRQVEGGGREFLVKWKGYSSKETTWEVEANILEKGMIKAVLKKPAFGQKVKPKPKKTADKGGTAPPAAPPPVEPTRARSARSGVGEAAARARRAQESEGEEEEEEEEEAAVRPPKKPKAPVAAPAPKPKPKQRARARPAADAKSKAPAKKGPAVVSQDSSDDEGAHKAQCPAPAKPDSSDDEPSE